MSFELSFSNLWNYDAGKSGITIPITLKLTENQVTFDAKVDTGATDCIFARKFGEELGLEIESGEQINISTATGIFVAYGHEVTMSVLNFDIDSFIFFAKNEDFNRNVLGRRSFLDQFVFGLVDYEGKLYLGDYNQI